MEAPTSTSKAIATLIAVVLFIGANPLVGYWLLNGMGLRVSLVACYSAWFLGLLLAGNVWLIITLLFSKPETELTTEQLKEKIGYHQ